MLPPEQNETKDVLFDACSKPSTSLDVIKYLKETYPTEIRKTINSNFPLHIAYETGASVETIRYLCESFPESIKICNE